MGRGGTLVAHRHTGPGGDRPGPALGVLGIRRGSGDVAGARVTVLDAEHVKPART